MTSNNKKHLTPTAQFLFFKDFVHTSEWRSIRFKASLLSALCISFGVLFPFFLGFTLSLKQGGSNSFLGYFWFITIICIIMSIPISVFFIRIGMRLYNAVIVKNLKNRGF